MASFLPNTQCIHKDDNIMQFSAQIHSSLQAFDGHFPEFAVFPGVAQLAIVQDIINMHCADFGTIGRIEQLRFQNFILPNHDVVIELERSTDNITFKIKNTAAQVVASGRLYPQAEWN